MAEKKETKTAAEKKTPKRVRVRLPREPEGGDPYVFVAVNGKAIRIKRGAEVEIPESYAKVLRNSERAAEIVDRFIEENSYNG